MKSAPPKNEKTSGSFSDLFPPSLIKDIRQSYKNPLYLSLIILGLIYIGLGAKAGMDAGALIFSIITITCFILPMRAGMAVALDLKEQGSNFLMLSPLSPMQIIWGQFLSGLLQAGLLCLLISPALHHALYGAAMEHSQNGSRILNDTLLKQIEIVQSIQFTAYIIITIIAGAAATTALMILNAIVPILCRVGLAVIAAITIGSIVTSNLFYNAGAEKLLYIIPLYVPVLIIITPLLLLLAQRHYASPSEVTSGRLRLLCALYTVGTCAWFILDPHKGDSFLHLCISTIIVLAALAVDELLPLEQMHRSIIKRNYLRKTCSGMTLILMLSCVGAATGAIYMGLQEILPSIAPANLENLPQHVKENLPIYGACVMLSFGLSAIYSFYAPLLLTNIISSRNNRNRFVIFACCVLGIGLATSLIRVKINNIEEIAPFSSFTEIAQTARGMLKLLEEGYAYAADYDRFGELSQHHLIFLALAAVVPALLSIFLLRRK